MKKKGPGWEIPAIGFGIILLTILFSLTSLYQGIENKLLDLRFKFRKPIPLTDKITHIDIDDKSLEIVGRWPWPRDKHARLLKLMNDLRARGPMVFDINFYEQGEILAEPEQLIELMECVSNPPLEESPINEYKQYTHSLRENVSSTIYNYDFIFARAIKANENVYLVCDFPLACDVANSPVPPEQLPQSFTSGRIKYPAKTKPQSSDDRIARLPLSIFAEPARGIGSVDYAPDSDGILRRIELVQKYQGNYYPQIAFRVACETLGISPDMIHVIPNQRIELERENQPTIIIPLDDENKTLINWMGNRQIDWLQTFNHLSYCHLIETVSHAMEILRQAEDKNITKEQISQAEATIEEVLPMLQDKIFMVGMVATGCTDLKPTPNAPLVPGVMLHSSIINMILTDSFIQRVPNWVNLLIILVFGALITLLAGRLNPLLSVLLSIILVLTYCYIGLEAFSNYSTWIDLTGPLCVGFFSFTSIKVFRTISEERAKKQIKSIFGHYLAPQVVNELLESPEKLKLGGEKRVMTVFFSDIANFTNMSSGLSAQVIMHWINKYLTSMTNIIQDHYGMIDKYEGDAIMALFGAPLARPDHAKQACWSALEQLKGITKLNKNFAKAGLPQINIRAGINSGEMVVGNLGSEKVMDYTVMGEEVILASRLEGINKMYKTQLLVSESTYQACKDDIVAREVDHIRAKGMERPVRIYQLITKKGDADSNTLEIINQYALALEAYRAQAWDKSVEILNQCLKIKADDGPSLKLIDQCNQFKQNPPAKDWDGIDILTSKG